MYTRNGTAYASSRDVAAFFGKQHGHVLRDIDALIYGMAGSPILDGLFIERTEHHNKARKDVRLFDMTRDGFTLLAMGFTGKTALAFKVRYVEGEAQLMALHCSTEEFPMTDGSAFRAVIDQAALPPHFPTNRHAPEFWEQLGRTIATFGFLEEVLGKAIFAFNATREYSSEDIEAEFKSWLPKLERALTDQLSKLADSYGKAVRDNGKATIDNVDELVAEIKEVTVVRNVLCHGS